jgi:cytochrome P450
MPVEYDPFDDVLKDDPFPLYARLRAESPVYYVEAQDSWALSRFDDIWNAGQDPDTYTSPGPPIAMIGVLPDGEARPRRELLSSLNPPVHTQMRKALAPLYSPRGVGHFEEDVRQTARRCIERALPMGRMDVVQDLGLHISVRVASRLIGLPLEDAGRLVSLVRRFFVRVPGIEGAPPDSALAAEELHAYLLDVVRRRRQEGGHSPDSDVIGILSGLQLEGQLLDDERVASPLNELLIGGTETLPKVFGGGVIQLHRHPDQRAALIANPELIPAAFNEIARYEMPTQFLTRTVARDHELRGQKLRAGQGVMFLYRAANRDPDEFPEPDRFDIQRRAPRILSFGHGTHVCLGQHAARLEGRVLFEELLAALPDYELDESEVVPERSEFVAGYQSVPIRFDPRSDGLATTQHR